MTLIEDTKLQIVRIQSPRNEFQIFLMLLSVLSGISIFFGKSNDPRMFSLPAWIYVSWGSILILSSLVNIFAAFFPWRDVQSGIYVEIASLVGLSIGPLVYSLALIGYADNPSVTRFLAIDLLAIGALVRLARLVTSVIIISRIRRSETAATLIVARNFSDPGKE